MTPADPATQQSEFPESGPGREPLRICIIRPSALGDVCRSVPVAASLRAKFPKARIEWIVQDTFIDAVRAHPAVDEVIPFARKHFGRFGRGIAPTRDFLQWSLDLRGRGYDIVYDCQGLARSAFIAWLTGARRRVGFADAREGGFLAYTHRHRVDVDAHTVTRMLNLLAADGVPPVHDLTLYTPADSERWWSDTQHRLQETAATGAPPIVSGTAIDDQFGPYAVFAPTSRWISKQWPAESFAAMVRLVLDRGFRRIVIVGAKGEEAQVRPLLDHVDGHRVISMLGATTVGGLMAIIAGSNLVLANDSAALHMAVGFDRPYLAFFGPTDTRLVGPWQGDRWTLQQVRPDERLHHKSDALGTTIMQRITVAEALRKLDERLAPSADEPAATTADRPDRAPEPQAARD